MLGMGKIAITRKGAASLGARLIQENALLVQRRSLEVLQLGIYFRTRGSASRLELRLQEARESYTRMSFVMLSKQLFLEGGGIIWP